MKKLVSGTEKIMVQMGCLGIKGRPERNNFVKKKGLPKVSLFNIELRKYEARRFPYCISHKWFCSVLQNNGVKDFIGIALYQYC